MSHGDSLAPPPVTLSGPQPSNTIVAACFAGLPERLTLARALVPGVRIVLHDDRIGLVHRLLALHAPVVLFPPLDAHGDDCAPLIERTIRELSDVKPAVLVGKGADGRGLTAAMRAGATLCTWSTEEDVVTALADLAGAPHTAPADRSFVMTLLGDLRPAACLDVLLACVEHSHASLTVDDLAPMFGMKRRALSRHMRVARWPAPSELIDWGRLLRASAVQWRDQGSLVSLARAAGARNPQALRRSASRLVGSRGTLRDILTPLGVATALRRRIKSLSMAT